MTNLAAARLGAIGLHVIVVLFGLAVGISVGAPDLSEMMRYSDVLPEYQRVLVLLVLVPAANLVGAILLSTRLFKSFAGVRWLIAYETAYLVAAIWFLAPEFAVVAAMIVLALLYVLVLRKREIVL